MNIQKIVSLTTSAFVAGTSILAAQKNLPNILYIFTDQQTANAMSCAGNTDLKTPHMDRLAREGIRFDNAYCAFPLSTPSRACMLTGATPNQLDIKSNVLELKAPYNNQTLGNLLGKNGYDCAYAGKWHIPEASIPDEKFGFKKLHEHNDIGLAESCVKYLSERPKNDKPFFLVASLDNPHNICEYARKQNLPFAEIEEPDIKDCPNLPANFAVQPFDASIIQYEKNLNFNFYPTLNYTTDDWRRYRNAYYRLTEIADTQIGLILKELDKQKLWDNTIIIFTSDHGDGNGSHQWNQKSSLYEEVVNIPFIITTPNQKHKGTVKHQLVNNGLDFFATVCDYAQVQMPAYCQGKSLRPLVEGKTEDFNDYVITETLFSPKGAYGYMVRTKDYKYVCYDKGLYREQLYDMRTDRIEMINLAVEKKYEDILKINRNILKDYLAKNNPPHLKMIPE